MTTANGTHMNGGGLDEKKVEGLRQEIDKLRLEIANVRFACTSKADT